MIKFLNYVFNGWVFEFWSDTNIEFTSPYNNTKYKLILVPYELPIIEVVSK